MRGPSRESSFGKRGANVIRQTMWKQLGIALTTKQINDLGKEIDRLTEVYPEEDLFAAADYYVERWGPSRGKVTYEEAVQQTKIRRSNEPIDRPKRRI